MVDMMNPIMFTIFGFEIRWYSFFLLIAVVIGIKLLLNEGDKYNYPKDFLFNLAFWVVIFGFIGARVYYVLFNYKMYINDPLSILKIWEGGLAIHGGIIAGFITLVLYCHKYNARILKITDMTTISLLLGQAIGRWGNFFNSEAHGGATTLYVLQNRHIPEFIINGMYINGVYYEPTFFYESLWCLLGVLILLIIRHYKYLKVGQLTGFYFMWYSFGRFFIESMRTDSLMFAGFKAAQLVSITLFIIGLIMVMTIGRKSHFEDLYSEEEGTDIRF
jgi:phosphatidylglycerol:prolipoprotein diacylglycerol transferase